MKHLIFLLLPIFSQAQTGFDLNAGKTLGTHYNMPYVGLGAQYSHDMLFAEAGMKTNWNEYYTLFYAGAGVQTKGKFYLAISSGISYTASLPQQDRYYDPATGITTVKTAGYTKAVCALYDNVNIGYRIKMDCDVIPYIGCSASWRKEWVSLGVLLKATY